MSHLYINHSRKLNFNVKVVFVPHALKATHVMLNFAPKNIQTKKTLLLKKIVSRIFMPMYVMTLT